MKFFNKVPGAVIAGAYGAAIVGMSIGCVRDERKEEEKRQQSYRAHGETPPTKFAGTWFEFTPSREPETDRKYFGPGL